MWNWGRIVVSFIVIALCLGDSSYHEVKVVDGNGVEKSVRLLVVTFATEQTEGLERLLRSCQAYGINLNVIELIVPAPPSTLHCEITIQFREWIQDFKHEEDLIVLLIDGYDMIFNAGADEIVQKFVDMDANVVTGAERICYPNIGMQHIFPEDLEGYKCLNFGTIMGYAPSMHALWHYKKFRQSTQCDDQIHFARLFILPQMQAEPMKMKLDHKANLVQNCYNLSNHDYKVVLKDNESEFVNLRYGTKPSLIHGNGKLGKDIINSVGNYVGKAWTVAGGCRSCMDGRIDLSKKQESDYPKVLIGIFIKQKTPFLPEMLRKVSELLYPKKKIFLHVYNNVAEHEKHIWQWISTHKHEYLSTNIDTIENRNSDVTPLALKACIELSCDLFFNVDSDVHLNNPDTLRLLVSYNRTILAPVIRKKTDYSSTFWVADLPWNLTISFDYEDIVDRKNTGIWNVPHIRGAFLVRRSVFPEERYWGMFGHWLDYYNEKHQFKYAVNYEAYGHLIDMKDVDANEKGSDLWQLHTNPQDWENKYLHPNISQLKYSTSEKGFPLFSERFCEDFKEAVFMSKKRQHRMQDLDSEGELRIYFHQMKYIGYQEEWTALFDKYILPLRKAMTTKREDEDEATHSVFRMAVMKKGTDQECNGEKLELELENEIRRTRGMLLSRCTSQDQILTFITLL